MKGLKTWVWMGCLCLGLILTVSMSEMTPSSFSWSTKERIDSTNSFKISEYPRRHYDSNQFAVPKVLRRHGQYEKMNGHYHLISGLPAQPVPINEKFSVGKRSVKRGEVNYFENLPDQSTLMSNSHGQVFKNLNTKKSMDGKNRNVDEYGNKHPGNLKKGKMMGTSISQPTGSKPQTTLQATLRINEIRSTEDAELLERGQHRSNHFLALTERQIKQYAYLFIMGNLRNGSKQTRIWVCNKLSRVECDWGSLEPTNLKSRYKRNTIETSKAAVKSKKERKQQIQEEADHRRKESAIRRKEARTEKRAGTKTRRLQLKNYRKPQGRSHATERLSISEEMRENREKMRSHEHPMKGKKGYHKHSSKGIGKRKRVSSEEKSSSKSSSGIEIKSIKKNSKHLKQKSKGGEKSKGRSKDGKKKKVDKKKMRKKTQGNHRKSRKHTGLHEESVVSKSSSSHKSTGKSVSESTAKAGDKHSSKKKPKSKKQNKNKKENGGSKKKKSDKKKSRGKGQDSEDEDEEKITHRKGGKLSNSKIKNSKKHVIVVSEESEEESEDREMNGGKREYKKHDESKHSQGKIKKSAKLKKKDNIGKHTKGSSAEKSSKHTAVHLEKKSKSAKMTKKSAKRTGKKPKPKNEKNEGKKENGQGRHTQKSKDDSNKKDATEGRSGNEKFSDEIEYMGHVLGFGLGKRKRPHSRTQVWSRRVHERPMTGGYASSGRLTRALSNLYGASASAGF